MFDKDTHGSSSKPFSVVGDTNAAMPTVELIEGTAADALNLDYCQAIADALGCRINWRSQMDEASDFDGPTGRALPKSTVFLGMTDKTEKALLDIAAGPDAPASGAQAVMVNIFSAPRTSKSLDVILSCPLSSASTCTTTPTTGQSWTVASQIVKTAVEHKRKNICYVRDHSGIDSIDLAPASLQMAALNNDFAFECQSEEAALAALLRNPQRWDMIICRPAIRRMLAALFIERAKLGVVVPFAVLSPERDIFGAEKRVHPDADCPTVLAQLHALLAMLNSLGMAHAAHRLKNAMRDVAAKGISVEGIFDAMPYATSLSAEDYVATILATISSKAPKPAPLKLMGR